MTANKYTDMTAYKKILLTVLTVILYGTLISIQAQTQEAQETKDFKHIKKLFQEEGRSIPVIYLSNIFKIDTTTLKTGTYKTKFMVHFDKTLIGLIYIYKCGAGGACEKTNMVIFNDGKLTDKIEIGHAYGDLGGLDQLTYKIKGNKIILKYRKTKSKETTSGATDETVIQNTTVTRIVNFNTGKVE
jgi:hypothetical protein